MDQLIDIGLPTLIACFAIFFIVYIFDYITDKIWANTKAPKVRAAIKWTWTMWLPIWPIIIGGIGGLIPGLPLPESIANLGPVPGFVSVVYGGFCGMISMALVKQVDVILEKKGIDIDIPDLGEAKLTAKQKKVEKVAEKIKSEHGGKMPSQMPKPPTG